MEIVLQKKGDKIIAYDDRTAKSYSIEELQKLALTGDSQAQMAMSDYYFAIKDYEGTVAWLTKAAENGYAGAQTTLGYAYYTGMMGVKKDPEKAEEWLRKAAEQGHAGGQAGLGSCYFSKEDYVNAKIWLEKAVAQGYADPYHEQAKMKLEVVMALLGTDYAPKQSQQAEAKTYARMGNDGVRKMYEYACTNLEHRDGKWFCGKFGEFGETTASAGPCRSYNHPQPRHYPPYYCPLANK